MCRGSEIERFPRRALLAQVAASAQKPTRPLFSTGWQMCVSKHRLRAIFFFSSGSSAHLLRFRAELKIAQLETLAGHEIYAQMEEAHCQFCSRPS